MNFRHIKPKKITESGFTIVELLIVIVVIGILAAITVVAYNGVTARAKTASAQSAASNIVKKAEAYNAEVTGYPTTLAALTGASQSTSYFVPSGTVTLMTSNPSSAPASVNSIRFYACDSGAGVKIGYWNYSTNAFIDNSTTTYTAGVVSGTCTASGT